MYTQIKSYTQLPTTPWQIFFPLFPVYYTQQNTISAAHDNVLERKKNKRTQELFSITAENSFWELQWHQNFSSFAKAYFCLKRWYLWTSWFPDSSAFPIRVSPASSSCSRRLLRYTSHHLLRYAFASPLRVRTGAVLRKTGPGGVPHRGKPLKKKHSGNTYNLRER